MEGIPFEVEGIPFELEGIPFEAEGIPFWLEGIPFASEGIPFDMEGFPFATEGIPFEVEGMPFRTGFCPNKKECHGALMLYYSRTKRRNRRVSQREGRQVRLLTKRYNLRIAAWLNLPIIVLL
ncbi:hypothetical protein FACS1894200_11910 [Spirochaetia bacterium]|nr:hypothetical protein FACS1894200_11910 [Spirochaetia bacterium]